MSRRVLGLEIRASSVGAVLLESSFKGSVLQAQAFVTLAETDTAEDDEANLLNALISVVDTLNPAGATCVLGIPTTMVSFRNLSLPFSDLKKIRQILPFELEPSLPLPVDELLFDVETVKRDGQQHDLLAFSVQKNHIQRYLDLLQKVNLRPVAIMPSAYAAAHSMALDASSTGDFVFIDTGDGHHSAYMVCSGHVRMVRSLPVIREATQLLRNLETTLERTFTATRDSLDIDFNPTSVVLGGPDAGLLPPAGNDPGMLGLPVRSLSEVRSFSRLKGEFNDPAWQTGQLDGALALALVETEGMAGINFSTERTSVQHYWSEYRGQIILTATLLLLTIIAALGAQMLSVTARQRQVAALDSQIEAVFRETFPEITRVVNPLQQMQIKIREAGDAGLGPEMPGAGVRVIDILNGLSQQIPDTVDVKVNRMVMGADNVVLSGNTDTFNTVDDIKMRLEKADIFKSVMISSADLEKSGQRVRFKLKLDF
ncbi:hypothetical protein DSCO28_07180 [Desulfosarcina ovata subsp. sediminis]|uniref:GspL periplasmic domain-containing protein n=1 Tax=Desulfosarcina ovata subsp. sediminis TaxID=885957 RepID=A0A5K7ZDS1_9BACT|nr:type II secretion system protein GspL [Desulfosarcina ovata]BBO80152.1 hypothetical protein DSCO28_07180 [Desulfosarcina ovata subsp. sediminis]